MYSMTNITTMVHKRVRPPSLMPWMSDQRIRNILSMRTMRMRRTRRSTRSTCAVRTMALSMPSGPRIHMGSTPVNMIREKSQKLARFQSQIQLSTDIRRAASTTKIPVKMCSRIQNRNTSESSGIDAWIPMRRPLAIMMPPRISSKFGERTIVFMYGNGCTNWGDLRRISSLFAALSTALMPVIFLKQRTAAYLLSISSSSSSICSVVW
mmetsp:Transcript_88671/g.251389  ORF Transcript_88671/g.251389 Transcript_88671/m.251389 type:complete len:209 (+) Transcript_88671:969-1595(+)